ncbi:hypothetical protein FC52_GL001590 [Lactobacillus pasteurii DSM 23907 = CRBIP 24.76]|uniref:Uncharacterized protein n=1 Tax=Lactobacillus pasteurii DSM 23907 = CRBIP 24.76 TaxID=1423790 RepID=I7LD99_9LACO|nr:hypothetical protein [Lactobacillus pasteurii]KRK07700.1 hypothetical protein FC52_GL001590 [Lactobacillus pasteurii DSM 23907 = CRBIP 24.76]TDG77709.1 hypothetical protein C5L33_000120 [Lactobacillus pasteurii]CCI84708.1 Protein of unknown function [Lactobacillus pasteurii DSM 23907 = CRBIP 24.76]
MLGISSGGVGLGPIGSVAAGAASFTKMVVLFKSLDLPKISKKIMKDKDHVGLSRFTKKVKGTND